MKKLLAIILAALMLVSLVTGCGAGNETPADETPAAESAEAPAQEDSAAADEPEIQDEAPAADSEESAPQYEKVSYDLPLYPDGAKFSFFYALRGGQGTSMPGRDDSANVFWTKIQEELNVDFDFQEPGEQVVSEKFNLLIASGDFTDIICENMVSMEGAAYTGGYDKAIDDDIYIDLMEYIEYAPNYAYYALGDEANRKVCVTDAGRIGAFFTISNESDMPNLGLTVNADYLAATGLDMPTTISEWLVVAEAMKNNGVQYPIDANSGGSIMNGQFMNAMGASLTTGFLVEKESGNFVFGPTTPETREYIELFIDCFDKGWIDPDWTVNSGMENPKFNQGLLSTKDSMAEHISTNFANYGINLEPCPIIRREGYGPGQTAIVSMSTSNTNAGGGMVITTACDDIEGAMKFFDWCYSDEGADICNYGWTEGETYYVEDGQKFITDFYTSRSDLGFGNKSIYTSDGDFGLKYPNMTYYVADDIYKTAAQLWTSDTSTESAIYLSLPSAVRLTSEESESLSSQIADLETYVESTVFRWLCKEDPLTDEAWDEYVATCQSMRMDEIQAAYEAAYDRYLAK